MMEPLPESLPLLATDRLSDAEDHFVIYTHSAKSRYLVLAVLGTYLVLFTFFTNFAREKVLGINQLPDAFVLSGDFEITRIATYLISGLGWLLAVAFLVYFIYAVIDIWGLQVCVNKREIRVQNTIMGQSMKQFTGVGQMAMEDIVSIHPKPMVTHLHSHAGSIRFSPVDRLESLIGTIMTHATHAKIND